ncbi:MAG: hypothetical protein WBQ71_09940 [Trebonia sp.]|jgi:transaldolase
MKAVADAGVDLDDVFGDLEDEGIQKFVDCGPTVGSSSFRG